MILIHFVCKLIRLGCSWSLRSGSGGGQVMDRNKDGKLTLDEVEQCLVPGTYRYREFHKALKLSTPEGFKARAGRWCLRVVGVKMAATPERILGVELP